MNSNWFIYNKKKNISEMIQKYGLSALTSVILCNRDIYEDGDVKKILSSSLDDLNDEKLLPDVDKAASILNEYIKANKNIRIVGDYDIDGVCSTYILYSSIVKLCPNISFAIPDRLSDGYGINISIIDKAIKDKVDLIITCDNGIAADEQIRYAKEHGIEVIVTDHHDIIDIPKAASAVVDPKRKDGESSYPFDGICGAVVAWKFMMRYYELYGLDKNRVIEDYLEFAILATIGDIMPLINENHIIAKLGLSKIVHTKNKGLKRLLEVSDIDYLNKEVTNYHIGFIIGPLINAAGRMDNAGLALKLFLSDDDEEINSIALTLKKLNDERKKMTEDGVMLAIKDIEEKYRDDKVIVVYVKNLGEQVAGIVAGRIKDKYNKPSIVLTDTFEESEAKASCRSIEEYDIFEALALHKEMFLKFGGHKMAAGFSINKNDIEKLRELLNKECDLEESDFIPKLHIDAEFPFYNFDLDLMSDLDKIKPFGQMLQKPLFATKGVKCSIKNVYGTDNNIVQLYLTKDDVTIKGVAFTDSKLLKERLSKNDIIDIVYTPKINEFRGTKSVDITVMEYR